MLAQHPQPKKIEFKVPFCSTLRAAWTDQGFPGSYRALEESVQFFWIFLAPGRFGEGPRAKPGLAAGAQRTKTSSFPQQELEVNPVLLILIRGFYSLCSAVFTGFELARVLLEPKPELVGKAAKVQVELRNPG